MIFKKLLTTLFKSTKLGKKSMGNSMDLIDDLLEKEYISNTIKGVKNATGKVVEKAGETYQKTVNVVEENINIDSIKTKVQEAVEKGKTAVEDLTDDISEKSETLKTVIKEGEELIDKVKSKVDKK